MISFHIKICGVTSSASVDACLNAGADAIGLNCYPPSKRYVCPKVAVELAKMIPENVARVGVFVNEPVESVLQLADQLQLDFAQLHGDETPEYASRLSGLPYLRAFRYGAAGLAVVDQFLQQTTDLGCPPAGILLDADVPGEFGGTGNQADWNRLAEERSESANAGQANVNSKFPLTLAGGLTPDNVANAIRLVKPHAVDTASGVESEPGEKAPQLATLFVKLAQQAFESERRS